MKLNSIVADLPETETLRLNAQVKAFAARGKTVFNLTAGELDFPTPRVLRQEVARHLQDNKYTPVLGVERLRRAVAAQVAKLHGLSPVSWKNIAVTAGAKQGLAEVLQVVLNRGEEVIIPTPAWVSYEHQVRLAGGRPVFVPLKPDFDLDAAGINAALTSKTKALILNSPHNPTGKIFSKAAMQALAKLLRSRRIYVIADAVYQSLSYTNHPPPMARYFKKNFVLVGGFSKSHALTGWRVGYVAAAPNIVDALGRLQGHTSGNAAVLSQAAGLKAAVSPKVTADFVSVLKIRRQLVAKLLMCIPRIRFMLPDGAFYFFLDISKLTRDSAKFCRVLLKTTGVALVPGEAFYAPGFVRLSFAAPKNVLKTGLRRLEKFVKLHAV